MNLVINKINYVALPLTVLIVALFLMFVFVSHAYASQTCSISGFSSPLIPNGQLNLSLTYSQSWETNDKMHNEIDWYEKDPTTGTLRFSGTGSCSPTTDALGSFSKQCDSERSSPPTNQNVAYTAAKTGTTIIEAHAYYWYGGGSCDSCQSKADKSHAYCDTALLTVANPTPTPRPTPTSTLPASPTVSFSSACLDSAGKATKVSLSWTSRTPAVTSVDVSTSNSWPANPTLADWHKNPQGLSVTAPDGFIANDAAATAAGPLTFTPGSTYYTSVWDGFVHSSPNTAFLIPNNLTSCNPTPNITVSGKLYDKTTNQPLSGKTLDTCPTNMWWQTAWNNPATDSNGNFSFQIPKGYIFCVRGPQVSGYSTTTAVNKIPAAPEPGSYEWQVAGYDCAGADKSGSACGNTETQTRDRASDGGYDLAYTPISTPTPSPTATPNPAKTLAKIQLFEDPTFTTLKQELTPPFNLNFTYTFSDPTHGNKTLCARFIATDGTQADACNNIDLVGADPSLSQVDCARDASNNVSFTISGTNFGTKPGTVESASTALTVTGNWTDTAISASYPSAPADKTTFDVTLTRFDGQGGTKTSSVCTLQTTQLSVGADYFCPAVPDHQEDNVSLIIYDGEATDSATGKATELKRETVSINAQGIIQGSTFQYTPGHKYIISIGISISTRQNSPVFTAPSTQQGSTVIARVQLPVGDIAPVSAKDGKINSLDKDELDNQWGVFTGTRTGDFNKDVTVNSFDWACMRYNFADPLLNTDQPAPALPNPTPTPTPSSSPLPPQSPTPTPTPSLTPVPSSS